MTPREPNTPRMAEYECYGGPFDGSLLPCYGRDQVVKVLERSHLSYRYTLESEDTGAKFWRFTGVTEGAMAP